MRSERLLLSSAFLSLFRLSRFLCLSVSLYLSVFLSRSLAPFLLMPPRLQYVIKKQPMVTTRAFMRA